jgi:predicted Zn-dependent peptidase
MRTALLLALGATVAGAQGRSGTPPSSDGTAEFVAGGIKVIHKPVTANDVVAVRLLLLGGASAITTANEGIEALIAQTIDKGTAKYDKDAFSALATSTGTQVGGVPALDYTAFFAQGVRTHFNETWDLFTQAALHPTFPAEEVAQAKEQIINGLKQRPDDPDSYLNLVADSLLYEGHAYAAEPGGSPESIARLTPADLAAWHKRRMTKANLVLIVVGNVSRADLTSKIAAAFGPLPATGGSATPAGPIASKPSTVTIIERELPTNYIQGIFATPGRAHPDYPALQVATSLLSERLFEEVRTKRNLTYAVAAFISGATQSKGTLYVTAVSPDTTVKVILSEVKKIQNEPVPLGRLKETVNVFLTEYWMGQETNMGQATSLGNWEVTGGGWRNARLFATRSAAITPADVQRVSAKYLKNARFVVIGDPKKVTPSLLTTF